MSNNESIADPARSGPLGRNSGGQDPAAQDPAAQDRMLDEKVRLQLAIFEVTRDAGGRSLPEIQAMLRAAFARHGVETPPATWVESVASSAFYGEPYIVDLTAAVAADLIVPAPNEDLRKRLADRRELRAEELPAGILPAPSEWELSPSEVTTAGPDRARRGAFPVLAARAGASRELVAAAVLAAAVLLALAAVRASRRQSRTRGTIQGTSQATGT